MDRYAIKEFLAKRAAVKRELDSWAKVSWGIFSGAFIMATLLRSWSVTNSAGHDILLRGGKIGIGMGVVLIGVYFWRKRVLEKQLDVMHGFLSREEQRSIALGEHDKEANPN